MDKAGTIVIMDDDIDYANFILDVIQSLGLNGIIITNPNHFMEVFSSAITLIFLDLNIPNINGLDLLRFIEQQQGTCDIILMSGVEDRVLETAEAFAVSIKLSIAGRFQKTIRLRELEDLLKKIISTKPTEVIEYAPKSLTEFNISEEAVTQALQNDEFVVYYQPKIDIATRGLYGVEALVRWLNPKNELLFPDQFVSHIESFGLIDDLSWVIIQKAIKEIEDLQNQINLPFKLALNISPNTLKDLEFPNKFLKILELSTITTDKIIFEIIESVLINDLSSALEIFTRLRLHNIHLSIDDFGTGFAMMQQLKIIPASEIKIDKSFVQNIFAEKSAEVTVKKVIEIGHELGMKVVAEGVETEEQLKFLQTHHCDIAQGYYFCKPIPKLDFHHWINNHYGF